MACARACCFVLLLLAYLALPVCPRPRFPTCFRFSLAVVLAVLYNACDVRQSRESVTKSKECFGTIPPFLLCDNACCKTRRPRSPRRNTSSRVPRGLRGPRRLRRHDLLRGVPAWEIQEHGRLNALLRLQERAMDHSEHGIQRPRGVRVQGRLLQGSHARRKHVASLSSSLSSSLDDRRW